MKTGFIALLSDFGTNDPFVATMKGVILSKAPKVDIIDITHQIPPQDITTAGFYLMSSMSYMPKNTLFLCVVDPAVGMGRGIIWAKTKNYQFICPDNGIISWVEEIEPVIESRFVNNSRLFLKKISSTFHGRDIMAPVAAEIAKGFPEKNLGPIFTEYRKNPFPRQTKTGNRIAGEVIGIDYFGNVITSIDQKYIKAASILNIANKTIKGIKLTYASVDDGVDLALIGSFGFLEFSARGGSFAKNHDIKIGQKVEAIISLDENYI
ncbi:MAG: SAM-dependent chlorinase/fluorinase [Elusimicrobiales bacterium]|nr:SAM-dependent chlorinase/fluorinase [Elusimicrobiales bacterium]MCK5357819.1 SAM-dependent chlorinase/fluorinase [Elusimicrobiales bacterium]MCK5583092.1 SAM-dependent chlorinase/fluorinase [Elusimicrobiales bacterium]